MADSAQSGTSVQLAERRRRRRRRRATTTTTTRGKERKGGGGATEGTTGARARAAAANCEGCEGCEGCDERQRRATAFFYLFIYFFVLTRERASEPVSEPAASGHVSERVWGNRKSAMAAAGSAAGSAGQDRVTGVAGVAGATSSCVAPLGELRCTALAGAVSDSDWPLCAQPCGPAGNGAQTSRVRADKPPRWAVSRSRARDSGGGCCPRDSACPARRVTWSVTWSVWCARRLARPPPAAAPAALRPPLQKEILWPAQFAQFKTIQGQSATHRAVFGCAGPQHASAAQRRRRALRAGGASTWRWTAGSNGGPSATAASAAVPPAPPRAPPGAPQRTPASSRWRQTSP